MLVPLDQGTPRGIAASLQGHSVKEAKAQGWDLLKNGELLDAAKAAGFKPRSRSHLIGSCEKSFVRTQSTRIAHSFNSRLALPSNINI